MQRNAIANVNEEKKFKKIKRSASGSLISTGSIFHNMHTCKVRSNWIIVVDETKKNTGILLIYMSIPFDDSSLFLDKDSPFWTQSNSFKFNEQTNMMIESSNSFPSKLFSEWERNHFYRYFISFYFNVIEMYLLASNWMFKRPYKMIEFNWQPHKHLHTITSKS